MNQVDTLTFCVYAGRIVELLAVDSAKGRGLIRALRGKPFGWDGSDVMSDVANVALSYLTDVCAVGMAEAQKPIPVSLPHVVVDAPSFA